MIPEDSDHGSRSGPALPAGVNPHAADSERRAFLKKMGKGAKYVAPTLTVLTFSRQSLAADEISLPPPLPKRYQSYRQPKKP